MTSENYRLYSFTNMYLSSIQKGIQTAHLVGKLSLSGYIHDYEIYKKWAEVDRTIIVLDGGNSSNLTKIYDFLCDNYIYHPYGIFHEDYKSLAGAATATGIILPERIYNQKFMENNLSLQENIISQLISKYKLAV